MKEFTTISHNDLINPQNICEGVTTSALQIDEGAFMHLIQVGDFLTGVQLVIISGIILFRKMVAFHGNVLCK